MWKKKRKTEHWLELVTSEYALFMVWMDGAEKTKSLNVKIYSSIYMTSECLSSTTSLSLPPSKACVCPTSLQLQWPVCVCDPRETPQKLSLEDWFHWCKQKGAMLPQDTVSVCDGVTFLAKVTELCCTSKLGQQRKNRTFVQCTARISHVGLHCIVGIESMTKNAVGYYEEFLMLRENQLLNITHLFQYRCHW